MATIDVSELHEEQTQFVQKLIEFFRESNKKQDKLKENWENIRKYGQNKASKSGLKEEDVQRLINEYRQYEKSCI